MQFTHDKLREKEIKKRIAEAERKNLQISSSFQFSEKEAKKRTPGNMDEQVKRRQAPRTIERVDKARILHEKDHITFKDDIATMTGLGNMAVDN